MNCLSKIQKLSRSSFFDCEKCIPNKMHTKLNSPHNHITLCDVPPWVQAESMKSTSALYQSYAIWSQVNKRFTEDIGYKNLFVWTKITWLDLLPWDNIHFGLWKSFRISSFILCIIALGLIISVTLITFCYWMWLDFFLCGNECFWLRKPFFISSFILDITRRWIIVIEAKISIVHCKWWSTRKCFQSNFWKYVLNVKYIL